MSNILKQNKPKLLQTDNGTEFYNNQFQDIMRKYSIKHYSTYSSIKAGIVERVIRTIKNKMYTHFTAAGSWNWCNSLNKLFQSYTVHRTISCTPLEARLNSGIIRYKTIVQKNHKKPESKLKINDNGWISKYKHNFSKGCTPNWTTEIFTIAQVLNTNPITYLLKDSFNNIITGCFYKEEIRKTKFTLFLLNVF